MADLALAEKSKSELVQTIEKDRKRARNQRLAEKAKRIPKVTFGTVIAAAGGAGAGVLNAKYPSIRGTPISGSDVAAGALIVAGVVGNGELADQAVTAGQGMLAGDAAIRTYKHWLTKK